MHCCVRDCDTDENVVSCTSVFFVCFPSDTRLRCEWLNILASHDSVPIDITENTRICSCHFEDESFGKHPVHGYRFLLPTAVPSIFPILQETLIVESFDSASVDGTLSTTPEEPEEPVELIPTSPSVHELISSPKTIGIQYADGKYYFLQSEDESEDELIEQVSPSECEFPQITLTDEIIQSDTTLLDGDPIIEPYECIEDVQSECKLTTDSNRWLEEKHVQPVEECEVLVPEEVSNETDSIIEEASIITTSEFMEIKQDIKDIRCGLENKESHDESNVYIEMIKEEILEEDDCKSEYESVEILDESGPPTASKEGRIDKHFCQYCGKGFPYESGLKKHLLVHTGVKPHACETCGKRFSQKINLTIHQRRHTGEETLKKYTCSICEKKCIRISELNNHIKTHWKKLPHACPLCTERFSDITNYYDHIKSQHKHELSLQQSIDLIALDENAELIVPGDADSSELDNGMFKCTVCSKTFKSERLLKRHKRKMHPKIFVCPSCPKQFLYRSLLDKHARVHTQEKPFKCEQCDTSFSQKVNLEIHLSRKHNVNVRHFIERCFECNFCHKTFDRPSSLRTHIRIHTKERPFVCAHCPRSYSTNSALASHIKTNHQGESILLNPLANKSFADTGSLITAERVASDFVKEVEDNDGNVIQYSIQIIDPPNITLQL